MTSFLSALFFSVYASLVISVEGSEESSLPDAVDTISASDLRSIVSFLASDELEGRDTPSPGLRVAARYLATGLEKFGFEPGAQDGTFLQKNEIKVQDPPRARLTLSLNGTEIELTPDVDCKVATMTALSSPLELKGVPLAFEGSEGQVDCEGKVWVRYSKDPNEARGASMMQARGRGAKALLFLDPDGTLWNSAEPKPRVAGRRSRTFRLPPLIVIRRQDVLEEIASALGVEVGSLADAPSTLLENMSLDIELTPPPDRGVEVSNVIGILRGSDPELSKEAVVLSAHYDHIGVGGSGEDRIHNGADDDATGCSCVMEIAEAMASMDARPARTVIAMFFYGEEKGMLGSTFYCQNPLWPLEQTVVDINLEMLGRPEQLGLNRAWVTGFDQSNLAEILVEEAEKVGVEVFNNGQLSRRLYSASDNISFVRKGVIAHSVSAGSLHPDYHRPTDEADRIDYENMARVCQALFLGALRVAQGEEMKATNR